MPDGKGIVMRLETDRLIIDHFTGSDVSMWAEIEADPDVRRFVDGQCLSREQASQYVQMNMDSYVENGFGRFAVRSRASGSLLGMCGFLPEEEDIDSGYCYSVETWGKGIGYEAAEKVLHHGREHLRLAPLCAVVALENIGSVRILEKLGFKFEKSFLVGEIKAARYVI